MDWNELEWNICTTTRWWEAIERTIACHIGLETDDLLWILNSPIRKEQNQNKTSTNMMNALEELAKLDEDEIEEIMG